ncbi:MAG: hypothetical protein NT080_04910 [Spirochaetes bacterium]|nr:hypothetical protein [Spirochaetota bacterium]
MTDAELEALSSGWRAALEHEELRAVRDFFRARGRPCTDVEFEMIAQTWSEHCVHRTFRAPIDVDAPRPHPHADRVDSVLTTFISRPARSVPRRRRGRRVGARSRESTHPSPGAASGISNAGCTRPNGSSCLQP